MKKINNLVLIFLLLDCCLIFAQDDPTNYLPNITPPSPVAYELGKYGNQPVGLFTGSTNISIPLCTFKTNNLEVPINMFYNKTGIKVDETSGNVGLGWNINMGGVINRVIRDLEDDSFMNFPTQPVLDGNDAARAQYYYEIGGSNVDSEPDLYSFNFNGNSGQFIYDKDGTILMLKDSKIRIERNLQGFIATDTNGIEYFFSATETTRRYNNGSGHQEPNFEITAWYLTKIVHPNSDIINLTYENADAIYQTSKSQRLSVPVEHSYEACPTSFGTPQILMTNIADDFLDIVGKRLINISSNNQKFGKIEISYGHPDPDNPEFNQISQIVKKTESNNIVESYQFNYLDTPNNRTFLSSVVFIDPNQNYSFEYNDPSLFPNRLSLSQDLWGYYNGKGNTSIITNGLNAYNLQPNDYNGAIRNVDFAKAKFGMLSKIVYPTKGYTIFDYDPNDYFGEQVLEAPFVSQTLSANGGVPNGDSTSLTITFPIDTEVRITGTVGQSSSSCTAGHEVYNAWVTVNSSPAVSVWIGKLFQDLYMIRLAPKVWDTFTRNMIALGGYVLRAGIPETFPHKPLTTY